jgi:hypothetical protein
MCLSDLGNHMGLPLQAGGLNDGQLFTDFGENL